MQENKNFHGYFRMCNFSSCNTYIRTGTADRNHHLCSCRGTGIEIGIFFFYALVSAFVGMIVGIVYAGFINKQDQKNKHFYTFDDLDEEAASMGDTTGKERMGALIALSILLVLIILILSWEVSVP